MTFSLWQLVATILAALCSGALIGVLLQHRRELPKAAAQARKTEAEAERIETETDDIKIASLERQVARLDQRVEALESEVEECHQDRDLALAAARYLLDRLRTVAPTDDAIERLSEYLNQPPIIRLPRSFKASAAGLDKID